MYTVYRLVPPRHTRRASLNTRHGQRDRGPPARNTVIYTNGRTRADSRRVRGMFLPSRGTEDRRDRRTTGRESRAASAAARPAKKSKRSLRSIARTSPPAVARCAVRPRPPRVRSRGARRFTAPRVTRVKTENQKKKIQELAHEFARQPVRFTHRGN